MKNDDLNLGMLEIIIARQFTSGVHVRLSKSGDFDIEVHIWRRQSVRPAHLFIVPAQAFSDYATRLSSIPLDIPSFLEMITQT